MTYLHIKSICKYSKNPANKQICGIFSVCGCLLALKEKSGSFVKKNHFTKYSVDRVWVFQYNESEKSVHTMI